MKKWIIVGIILFVVLGGIYYLSLPRADQPNSVAPTPTTTVTVTPTPTKELITYNGPTPVAESKFIEAMPVISGEQGYVAFPKTIEKDNPPAIVIYYHGSGQKISKNFSDSVMKNMREYGAYFTERNMAFLASNQHGDNQGKEIAVTDSDNLINWVKKNYLISKKLFVVGFSMGGKPAMRHVLMHPTTVNRIALLAPAQQIETYSATQIRYFRNVQLKVWHGTSDVNVPYWVTEELVSYFKKYGTPIEVETLKGKTHWDVDTEYIADIYKWFVKEN